MATYNERITQNNADLLALEAEVKALPDLKPEQEKTVTVTKNGDAVVTPDTGKTLSKATVKVAVPNNTSDATATAAEVFAGKTAYLADGKHSGTFTIEQELADQTAKLNALEQALQGKAGGGGGGSETLDALIEGTLTEITSNAATSVGKYVFYNCNSLTAVSFPAVTSISDSAFQNCASLTTVSFPVATSIGNSAFYNCRNFTTVSFPVVTSIGGGAFRNCNSLTAVSFPAVTSIGNSAFYNCRNLTTVSSFPVVTSIGSGAFGVCKLTSLILSGDSVCQASGDPQIGSSAFIYVPKALIEEYKAATNWSKYAAQFRAIEDYPGIVGG